MRLRYRDKSPPSRLESKFALYWRGLGGPELEREFRFHPERKWRADFAHIESRTLIEIEGGIYIQGRHNRAAGFIADAEKYLEAFLAGWSVVRLTSAQISTPTVERLIAAIRSRGVRLV
jgi:very-short-patch-repair endonuclease